MRYLILVFAVVTTGLAAGCGPKAVEADRDKFVGVWEGTYFCQDLRPHRDKLIIKKNPDDAGLLVTIHATATNPDTVKGKLTKPTVIAIPKQTMGGGPGTARITYIADGTLDYTQTGGGVTCKGTGYAKIEK